MNKKLTEEVEEIGEVDEEDQEVINNRLKQLFGDSAVYKHFIQGPTSPKGKSAKGGGRMKKGRMTEEEEDKLLLENADSGTSGKVIDRLEKQPSILVGTTLRSYQLEGMNWMIKLFNNGLSGILADEVSA